MEAWRLCGRPVCGKGLSTVCQYCRAEGALWQDLSLGVNYMYASSVCEMPAWQALREKAHPDLPLNKGGLHRCTVGY